MRQKTEKEWYLPGEFAKLYGISRDTLLFYDKIGLFSPEIRESNGYRLYSLDQCHRFDLILMLRSAGLSIESIKSYLTDYSPRRIADLLQAQSDKLEQEISELRRKAEKLRRTAGQIRDGLSAVPGGPRFEQLAEVRFLAVKGTQEMEEDRRLRMETVRNFLKERQVQEMAGDCLRHAVVLKEHLLAHSFVKDYYCVNLADGPCGGDALVQPAGSYAVIEHKGPYKDIISSYLRLIGFIEENGRTIAGNAYESELLGYASYQDGRDFLVRIAIQVSP